MQKTRYRAFWLEVTNVEIPKTITSFLALGLNIIDCIIAIFIAILVGNLVRIFILLLCSIFHIAPSEQSTFLAPFFLVPLPS